MTEVNLLARSYRVEVSNDGTAWVRPKGLDNLDDKFDDNMEPVDDYDTDGWGKKEKTLINWALTFNINRKTDSGVEDPGQKMLRDRRGKFGEDSRIYVRWFRTDGVDEAWSGVAVVSINRANTATKDIEASSVTLEGYGEATAITNPYVEASVPVVVSALPTAVAVGGVVTIKGQGFIGTVPTSGVKFGATNATTWSVVSDNTIVAVMPAGSAGSGAVVVTNATGASSSFAYTRGA